VDAAIAVQIDWGLIESPETGMAPADFFDCWHQAIRPITRCYDGRETAPARRNAEPCFNGGQIPYPSCCRSLFERGFKYGVPGWYPWLAMATEQGACPGPRVLERRQFALAEQGLPMHGRDGGGEEGEGGLGQKQIESDISLAVVQ